MLHLSKCSHLGGRHIVRDILFKRRDAAKEKITWQIESERKGIFTLNEEDLYSYKTEFVSACSSVQRAQNRGHTVDVTDPSVGIMGSVRGYFHGEEMVKQDELVLTLVTSPTTVSHKRFLDNVPLAINHELIYGLTHPDRGGLHDALYHRLGIDGAGADAQCERLL